MTYTKDIKTRLEKIIKEHLGIDITENNRKHKVVKGRMIAYRIMREQEVVKRHISESFKQNHATVLHHLNRFTHYYKHDKEFKADFDKVYNIFYNIKDKPIELIAKRIENPLYSLIDQVPEERRNDVKIRLEAMLVGFNIQPKNQQATIYDANAISVE
tara:strand:- start:811 stop:1284 length:474 start_codon:yes stop_codon:yes gene_type:complete